MNVTAIAEAVLATALVIHIWTTNDRLNDARNNLNSVHWDLNERLTKLSKVDPSCMKSDIFEGSSLLTRNLEIAQQKILELRRDLGALARAAGFEIRKVPPKSAVPETVEVVEVKPAAGKPEQVLGHKSNK